MRERRSADAHSHAMRRFTEVRSWHLMKAGKFLPSLRKNGREHQLRPMFPRHAKLSLPKLPSTNKEGEKCRNQTCFAKIQRRLYSSSPSVHLSTAVRDAPKWTRGHNAQEADKVRFKEGSDPQAAVARHARSPFRRPPARCVRAPRTSPADKASLDEDSRTRAALISIRRRQILRGASAYHLASLPVPCGRGQPQCAEDDRASSQ